MSVSRLDPYEMNKNFQTKLRPAFFFFSQLLLLQWSFSKEMPPGMIFLNFEFWAYAELYISTG